MIKQLAAQRNQLKETVAGEKKPREIEGKRLSQLFQAM